MGTGIDLNQNDAALSKVLREAKVIAVVGHSDNPGRTSYQIAGFLRRAGYKVYPVNPTLQSIDGEQSYPSVAAVPEKVDIVDVFRRSEYVAGVVEDAIAAGAKAVWTQLDLIDEAARQRALDAGLAVAMDRCIKVEFMRLGIRLP
jgi:predicted CoA-binding protein